MSDKQFQNDISMPTSDLISDFAEGIMIVCDENLELRKQENPNDYLDGDEIDYSVLHQSCHELFSILIHKEDAKEVIRQWTSHERWCVRALTKGTEHLLLEGSFNNSLDESDEEGDDFDSFVGWVDIIN